LLHAVRFLKTAPGTAFKVPRGADRIALGCVVAGALLRVLFVLVVHKPLDFVYSDMASYVGHAVRIASGAALNRYDVYEPTGTSLLLSLPMAILGATRSGLWGDAVLWSAFACVVPLATWRWSRALYGPGVGAWVAALCAFWPLLVLHAGYFLAETPAMALLMCAVWLGESARRNPSSFALALATGVLGGAAAAVRAQLLLNVLIVLVVVFRANRRAAGVMVGGAAAVILAVALFNSSAAGRPTGLSENGGMSFFQGQCDVAFVQGGPAARPFYFRLTVPAQTHDGRTYAFPGRQVYDQGFFYGQGWDCARRDGLGHISVLGRHLADMLATSTPWPEFDDGGAVRVVAEWSNRALASFLVLLALAGLATAARRRRLPSSVLIPAAHLACAPLVALVFIGDPRITLLYTPFALTLLGLALDEGIRAFSSHSVAARHAFERGSMCER
jgi:hypothetical protein